MRKAVTLLALMVLRAFSQTAELTGTVTDASGSAVPAVTVVAASIDTGVVRDTKTNDRGNYIVTSLLPGRYRITAEAAGFKQAAREPVTLAIDQVARIDFALEVGAVRESVTVETSVVILDAATSTIGTVVENQQISEVPLNGRDPIDLVALTTGVRIQGGFGGKGSWGNFSVNGGLAKLTRTRSWWRGWR
jgi:hypothetical protein